MIELGIVDIREIIRLIKSTYNYDFSSFALTSFKYRLEHIIAKNNLPNAEALYRKLADDPSFFDTFKFQIMVPSTEIFRDPSVWRWLREEYFSNLDDKSLMNFKVWIPFCVSGGELFSLSILLKELNLTNRIKIFATVFSEEAEKYIKSGEYPIKKIETSAENYKRFQGSESFNEYYTLEKYTARRNISLIENVEFIQDDLSLNKAPRNVKLILMRNAMIYFTPSYQEKILQKMHEQLSGAGTIMVGLQENMAKGQGPTPLFDAVEVDESIYKKRLN